MLRITFVFLFFVLGATLGHYFPINLWGAIPADTPMKDIGWTLKKGNGYLQTHIDGIIELIDMSSGTMTILYHPGYMPRDKKLIKINFFPDIEVEDRVNILQNGVNISQKTLPQKLGAQTLSVGNQVLITFKYNEPAKKLIVTNIIKQRRIQEL